MHNKRVNPAARSGAAALRRFWLPVTRAVRLGGSMKYKVELGFIDSESESKDIFYTTYVEAGSCGEAIEVAKMA